MKGELQICADLEEFTRILENDPAFSIARFFSITFVKTLPLQSFFFFEILFIYLKDRKNERLQRKREKQTPLWAGSPMCGSIPGPWDHEPDLSQRQMLNRLNHPHIHLLSLFIDYLSLDFSIPLVCSARNQSLPLSSVDQNFFIFIVSKMFLPRPLSTSDLPDTLLACCLGHHTI